MKHESHRIAVLVGVALAWTAAGAGAQMDGFEPIGDYVLQVEGELAAGAEILRSQTAGSAILVISSALPSPIVLRPRERTVELVRSASIVRQPDGSASLVGNPVAGPSGSFTVLPDGTGVSCSVEGRRVELTENPWQLGLHSRAELLAHSAGYAFLASKYNPSQTLLRSLRERGEEVTVRVYYGSWCPACQQLMPKVLKVAEALEDSKIRFEYYGLPRPFTGEVEAERAQIHSIPTGIVLRNGREIGRIQGNSWRIPELAVQNVLLDAAEGKAGK